MGASDILKNVNSEDIENAKINRESKTNPPDFAPGQEADFGDDFFSDSGDSFGGSDSFGDSFGGDFGGSSFGGDSFGGSSFGGGFGGSSQQSTQKSTEDKIFDMVCTAGKGSWSFLTALTSSFSDLDARFWSQYGGKCTVVGIISSVVGFISMLLGAGVDILVAGIFCTGIGVIVLMWNVEKANSLPPIEPENVEQEPEIDDPYSDDPYGDDSYSDDPYGFEGTEGFNKGEGFDDEDFFNEDESEKEDIFTDDIIGNKEKINNEPMDTEEALDNLEEVPHGMYTRQYLYEAFTRVLPNMESNYATAKEYDSSSDTFLAFESILQESAKALGENEEELPTLLELSETLFTIKLVSTRIKKDATKLANEIANIYAYSDGREKPGVYANAIVVGNKIIITLFTGESAMISLKDMMDNAKDFFLDTKNIIPVCMGIDELGTPITVDLKNIESMLVTGMPRSGKSWFVQAILTQMCAFSSPKDLVFYICDPKEGISDFKSFCLPHVKKFVSGDNNIVNVLRDVVKKEAPRRKALLGDANCVNIWDFKDIYPDVHLPIIYVIIDEVVTLAERMDKDTKNEFQGLLLELISQLPALGIRLFMIPHVVKNDILKKTITDLIPCRISVRGDESHIETSVGVKGFKYKLTNKGDMAVKITAISPKAMFIHAPALTKSNPENNKLFDYLRRVWKVLEPDEVKNSVAYSFEKEQEMSKVEKDILSKELDDTDIFDDIDKNGLVGFKKGVSSDKGNKYPIKNEKETIKSEKSEEFDIMSQFNMSSNIEDDFIGNSDKEDFVQSTDEEEDFTDDINEDYGFDDDIFK